MTDGKKAPEGSKLSESAQRQKDIETDGRFTEEKIARAKIIVRAADSAYDTNNVDLLFVGVLEALAMSKAEAIIVARAIDENTDFIKLISER
jgi:hypothetical protein